MFEEENEINNKLITPQLLELQALIQRKRPNDVMKFIRGWANQHVQQNEDTDNEDQLPCEKLKNIRRRNAVFVQTERIVEGINGDYKSEESKSIMIIYLKQLGILSVLQWKDLEQLVEGAKVVKVDNQQKEKKIIQKGEMIDKVGIILKGNVRRISNNQVILGVGEGLGEQTILFPAKSQSQYVSNHTEIAFIEGCQIRKIVREINEKKYRLIIKALLQIDFIRILDEEELDRVASAFINTQILSFIEKGQVVQQNKHRGQIFVVLTGIFSQYGRKLKGSLHGQPQRRYFEGNSFGGQTIADNIFFDYTIICEEEGAVIKINKADIEKIIGSVHKLYKRIKRY